MLRVEPYLKVRHAVIIDGMIRQAAAPYFGINRKTVDKMLAFTGGSIGMSATSDTP